MSQEDIEPEAELGLEEFEADLTPGVGLLGALKGLRYNEWYALAEYVDNSLSSYLRDIELIRKVHSNGISPRLSVHIRQSPDRLIIRDNAGGIAKEDIQRALSTGTPPIDRHQFNLYGIGMKAASIWFGDRFAIKTTRPGEAIGRLIEVDLRKVIEKNQGSVQIKKFAAPKRDHYTVIGLSHLRKPLIQGKTLGKVRDFLGSIYREYINDEILSLEVMDESAWYYRPPPLWAERFERPGVPAGDGQVLEWVKPIEFSFGLDAGSEGTAKGWAMVRETGSTANAGFALTQNRRVVEGAVEPWRPQEISGNVNKHRYQRLEGQLDIVGVEPEITKTNFRWSGAELERFIEALRKELDAEPLPLLRQADNYRHLTTPAPEHHEPDAEDAAREAVATTAAAVERAEEDVLRLLDEPPTGESDSESSPDTTSERFEDVRTVTFAGQSYEVKIELVDGTSADSDWLTLTQDQQDGSAQKKLRIQVNRASLFMKVFEGATGEAVRPMVRIGAALAIAETAAREGGADHAALIRQYVNQLLRGELGTD